MGNIAWQAGKAYREIIYETAGGIAKISINRPERRNAFTPLTVTELYDAFSGGTATTRPSRHHPDRRQPRRPP